LHTTAATPARGRRALGPVDVERLMQLYTVGHGTLPADTFGALVGDASMEQVVDVRSYPGSRRNPHFAREQMEQWLPTTGVEYRWMRELGGRRRPVPNSKHVALRNDSFQAYADYMETDDFRAGVARLLDLAAEQASAVMCSESVWWRCHRRLLADHL